MFIIYALILPLALCVDRIFGDPKSRFHPVALIGAFIDWWGSPGKWCPGQQRVAGAAMWIVTAAIFAIPFYLAEQFLP